jgi:RNA polymerase sigma-70 factor, ECF subfamily
VSLHYLRDLPVYDVARAMGTATGTVKAHLSRARAAMAKRLRGTVS